MEHDPQISGADYRLGGFPQLGERYDLLCRLNCMNGVVDGDPSFFVRSITPTHVLGASMRTTPTGSDPFQPGALPQTRTSKETSSVHPAHR
jgi:hypothetical protein